MRMNLLGRCGPLRCLTLFSFMFLWIFCLSFSSLQNATKSSYSVIGICEVITTLACYSRVLLAVINLIRKQKGVPRVTHIYCTSSDVLCLSLHSIRSAWSCCIKQYIWMYMCVCFCVLSLHQCCLSSAEIVWQERWTQASGSFRMFLLLGQFYIRLQ